MALTITLNLGDAQEAALIRAISERFAHLALPGGAGPSTPTPQVFVQEWLDQHITIGTSLLAQDEDKAILVSFKAAPPELREQIKPTSIRIEEAPETIR